MVEAQRTYEIDTVDGDLEWCSDSYLSGGQAQAVFALKSRLELNQYINKR